MGKRRREASISSRKRINYKRIRVISSSEEENNEEPTPRQCTGQNSSSRGRSITPRRLSSRQASPQRDEQHRSASPQPRNTYRDSSPQPRSSNSQPRCSSPKPGPSTTQQRALSPQPGPSNASADKVPDADEVELDESILELLGDAPKIDTPLGPPIHKDVANRWQEILAKGLPKEVKEKLLKEYMIPSNCDLLLAPILNPEAKAALTEVFVKRDSSLMNKQKQLSVALSALSKVTQLVISNETSKSKLLKPLSDACRILCDSHYMETKTRRYFVTSSVNASLRETLVEAERDKFLFGDNVGDKLKAAKNVQRSGDALKTQPKSTFTKNNFAYKRGRLNFKQQHRKTTNRPFDEPSRATRPTQRQPPRSNAIGARKQTDRDRSPQRKSYRR